MNLFFNKKHLVTKKKCTREGTQKGVTIAGVHFYQWRDEEIRGFFSWTTTHYATETGCGKDFL